MIGATKLSADRPDSARHRLAPPAPSTPQRDAPASTARRRTGRCSRSPQTVPGVTTVVLYADYLGFDSDIDREQARLLAHDAVVFQHALY